MAKNEIVQVGEGVYQIKYYWLGVANVYCYLIIGDEKALLIDSAYANTHAKEYVRSVTELPIVLVNTHGHFDHIGGNSEYEKAYMSEKDMDIAKEHSERDSLTQMMKRVRKKNALFKLLFAIPRIRKKVLDSLVSGPINWIGLPEDGCFELGGRKVSFFEIPGHTPGSICLFDEKTRFLFPGDMLCETGALLGFDYSTSVTEFKNSVLTMQKFAKDNNVADIYPSHHLAPATDEIFEKYKSLCDGIISGKIKGKLHDDGLTSGYKATDGDLSLVYRII